MDRETRAINFEVLINDAQILCIEVQGMKYENEACLHHGDIIPFTLDEFNTKANQLRRINEKMKKLANI